MLNQLDTSCKEIELDVLPESIGRIVLITKLALLIYLELVKLCMYTEVNGQRTTPY